MWALPFTESRNCGLMSQEQKLILSVIKCKLLLQRSGMENKKELKF